MCSLCNTCPLSLSPELPGGKRHLYSNKSNEVKKGEWVRNCGGVCCLMEVGYNRMLCWDKQGPLSACWSCWCMLCQVLLHWLCLCPAEGYPIKGSNSTCQLPANVVYFCPASYVGLFPFPRAKSEYFLNAIEARTAGIIMLCYHVTYKHSIIKRRWQISRIASVE